MIPRMSFRARFEPDTYTPQHFCARCHGTIAKSAPQVTEGNTHYHHNCHEGWLKCQQAKRYCA